MAVDNQPAIARPSLEDSLHQHDKFREALDSSQRLALEEFTERCEDLMAEMDAKREELEDYFAERSTYLESLEEAFGTAQREAIAAAEQLQSVQAELDAHRTQGQKQLADIKVSLKDLLSAVRGATVKHLLLGSSLVILHLAILAAATTRRDAKR